MLWFLLSCDQTWHRLLSGEGVSFPEDDGQGPQLRVEERVSIFKLNRSWGSQETGWEETREVSITDALLSSAGTIILPAEWVADRLPLELAQVSLDIWL